MKHIKSFMPELDLRLGIAQVIWEVNERYNIKDGLVLNVLKQIVNDLESHEAH